MATKLEKETDENEDLMQSLNAIINQNLTVGVYDGDDLNDDHVDMKSNVSLNWHRGSVSYSQPSSPKGNSSSPSFSSLSELSNETYDGDESESCASLNSVNSADSALRDVLHASAQTIIEENKEHMNPLPLPTSPQIKSQPRTPPPPKAKSNHKRTTKSKHAVSKSISFQDFVLSRSDSKPKKTKTQKTVHRSRKRKNSKDCLDITALARLTTKSIELWSISDVAQWVKLIDGGKYKEYASNFRSRKIDGKKLYKMNRAILQSIEIYHPSVRKAILAALQRLKIRMRKNARKKINIYAQTHGYEKKLQTNQPSKQHWRNLSSSRMKRANKKRYYVIAIKKQKSDTQCLQKPQNVLMPTLHTHMSSPIRKQRRDISEFLGEWDIKQSPSSNINFIGSHILEQTDNFTMIELTNKRIVYAMMNKVQKWNNNDVCKWLNSVSGSCFKRYIPKFQQRNTNGFDLLNISRVQLQNNIKMKDPEMRSRLLREIKLLKLATKPTKDKAKKRSSAVLMKDIEVSNLRAAKSVNTGHRKSASMYSGFMKEPAALHKARSAQSASHHKKLGPRDVGRIKYKGTKYKKSMFEYDFLEEKINYHAKSAQFNKRKRKNPVQHKETVDEIGISRDYHKPEYCNDVLRNMKRGAWLQDRPIARRNLVLDKLKGTKIPKGSKISDIHGPIGWQPIEYKYTNDGKAFLEEHFWYDGSGVQFEFGFSRLLNCLPPAKVLTLNKEPSPTGYESKLNWLKMLLNMVSEEMTLIRKEDALYRTVQIRVDERKVEEVEEGNDGEDETIAVIQEVIEDANEGKPQEETIENVKETETESASVTESDSNDELLSPRDLPEHDSSTMRKMYKRERNRANTTLANSTLNAVKPHVAVAQSRKRTLSRHDMNRRRFLSQESVDSIQAIISNIEKKRAGGNVNE